MQQARLSQALRYRFGIHRLRPVEPAGELEQLEVSQAVATSQLEDDRVLVDGRHCFQRLPDSPIEGRLRGKVALVTGAAQGFGAEIAVALAREGAFVALADIDEPGARNQATAICDETGLETLALRIDVSDEASVRSGFAELARAWGGLDLLIANAGVLRAGSVLEQDASEFDLVTQVNYRGFFLCVKHAAPLLAAARLGDPNAWTDIIQINSKSGLVGSNRNGAYAGSKFGAIGLVQSFALELVELGVKVNAVCPGNFFDGPLWSNPETGLFIQYLRAGKVPGASTIEDVRRAYEAKVPMGRGCEARDLVRAILYLIEQKYETGQALPVTGGQVMLG